MKGFTNRCPPETARPFRYFPVCSLPSGIPIRLPASTALPGQLSGMYVIADRIRAQDHGILVIAPGIQMPAAAPPLTTRQNGYLLVQPLNSLRLNAAKEKEAEKKRKGFIIEFSIMRLKTRENSPGNGTHGSLFPTGKGNPLAQDECFSLSLKRKTFTAPLPILRTANFKIVAGVPKKRTPPNRRGSCLQCAILFTT